MQGAKVIKGEPGQSIKGIIIHHFWEIERSVVPTEDLFFFLFLCNSWLPCVAKLPYSWD